MDDFNSFSFLGQPVCITTVYFNLFCIDSANNFQQDLSVDIGEINLASAPAVKNRDRCL